MTLDLPLAVSLLLGAFGICTMWMATGRSDAQRKWAPVVGLTAQLAWGWYAWLLGPAAGGLWILVALYAGVYVRGIWVQWDARRWLWQRLGRRASETQCVGCGRELTRDEAFHYIFNCERCEGFSWAAMQAEERGE